MNKVFFDLRGKGTGSYHEFADGLPLTITSREVAKITGKAHKAVRADIGRILSRTMQFNYECFEGVYTDSMNRQQAEYILSGNFIPFVLSKYEGMSRIPNRLREESALKTIEQLLDVALIRQYPVLSYRLDGYCEESNTAYEIDEPEHKSKILADAVRQAEIEAAIGCKFIRISL